MFRMLLLFLLAMPVAAAAQDEEWFSGGDDGFYRYLEDRLQATASSRPYTLRNGETVIFEFVVTDSGMVDSVRLGTCFNVNLCMQLRLILNTMPRVKPRYIDGRPVSSRRVYHVVIRSMPEGYRVEPAPQFDYAPRPASSHFKWGVAILAVVVMLIFIVK